MAVDTLKARWEELSADVTSILSNAERYAAWTLPSVFPPENQDKQAEMQLAPDAIGAQGVNHLSNKVVSTLFPDKGSFFRLIIDQEMRDTILAALTAQSKNAKQAQHQLAAAMLEVEEQLAASEKRAVQFLNMVKFRPLATTVGKLLIVTGNALEYHPEGGKPPVVYSLRNYRIVRDMAGEVIEIITRDIKAYETFHPSVQALLQQHDNGVKTYVSRKMSGTLNSADKSDRKCEVTIFTRINLEEDGRYHVTQSANDVPLDTEGAIYTKKDLRWIPLTWNLVHGEDYGRGLVADFAGAFHALNILTQSLLNIAAVLGDIKFFVDPLSGIDVATLNNSPAGSYHAGKGDAVSTAQLQALNQNLQVLSQFVERYERQISQAFLLQSMLTRDAERVTTEEIRMNAQDLETSNGGIYSRLAADWQVPLANLTLQDTGFNDLGDGIEAEIITGMDNLSRAGEAMNMRMFMADLGMLNSVPEDVRMGIKKPQFIAKLAGFHQVEYKEFIASEEEMQAAANAQMEAQQKLEETKQQGTVQAAAASAAVKE